MSHDLEQKFLLGGCTLNGNGETNGISPGDAFLLEFVCTFLLLFVGITVAFDKKRSKEVGHALGLLHVVSTAPMGLGVFISITITGTAGYSGVGLNPARCLSPALVRGGSLWHGHWVFWFAPILACVIYYLVFKTFPTKGLVVLEGEHDILSIGEACFKGSSTPVYIQKYE
ncbi:unnamed protein product [Prunus armeniaca]|uniref:Aquaporin n=1 Tax=Prunus armeniaca TaxID=36596 RepID=A0A6J5YC82_PRUAR|nr:unnamed protein product [Prunus armeniaca]